MSESSQKDMSEEEVISLCQKVEEDHRKMVKEKQQQTVEKPSSMNIVNDIENTNIKENTMSTTEEIKTENNNSNSNDNDERTYTVDQITMMMNTAQNMMNPNDPWYKAKTGQHNILQQIWYAGTGKSADDRYTSGDKLCINGIKALGALSVVYGTYKLVKYAYNTFIGDE